MTTAERQAGQTIELVRESLASAHERTGNVEAAVVVYNEFLRDDGRGWEPQQAWLGAHYRVARLHAQRGEHDQARARLDTLLELWKEADPDIPLLQAAKKLRDDLRAR